MRAVSNNQIDLSWTEPAIRGAKVTGYIVTEMVNGGAMDTDPSVACDTDGMYRGNDQGNEIGCLHISGWLSRERSGRRSTRC